MKEAVFEVNGLVIKGSHEDFYQAWSGKSTDIVVSNGTGVGKQKVTGLAELRSKRPNDYKAFLQWVVKKNKEGEKNKELSISMKNEWNVVLPPDRVWGIIDRYGNGYDWNKLDK